MTTASWILFFLGLLGAADIALFHTLAHAIRRHAPSRAELCVHALRGPTYALLFVGVPNLALEGAWFWALIALLTIDVGISVADFALERESRRLLGGLSSGEYVLHVLMAILFGALVASIAFEAGSGAALPTRIAWEPAPVPELLRLALGVMAAGVFVSGLLDALAVRRLGAQRVGTSPTTS